MDRQELTSGDEFLRRRKQLVRERIEMMAKEQEFTKDRISVKTYELGRMLHSAISLATKASSSPTANPTAAFSSASSSSAFLSRAPEQAEKQHPKPSLTLPLSHQQQEQQFVSQRTLTAVSSNTRKRAHEDSQRNPSASAPSSVGVEQDSEIKALLHKVLVRAKEEAGGEVATAQHSSNQHQQQQAPMLYSLNVGVKQNSPSMTTTTTNSSSTFASNRDSNFSSQLLQANFNNPNNNFTSTPLLLSLDVESVGHLHQQRPGSGAFPSSLSSSAGVSSPHSHQQHQRHRPLQVSYGNSCITAGLAPQGSVFANSRHLSKFLPLAKT